MGLHCSALKAEECPSPFALSPSFYALHCMHPPPPLSSEQTPIPELRFLFTFQVDGRWWLEWAKGRRRCLKWSHSNGQPKEKLFSPSRTPVSQWNVSSARSVLSEIVTASKGTVQIYKNMFMWHLKKLVEGSVSRGPDQGLSDKMS